MKKTIAGAVGALFMLSTSTVMAADVTACMACHMAGVGGAPVASPAGKADWEARFKANGGDAGAWLAQMKTNKTKSGGSERGLNPMMVPQVPTVTAEKIQALMAKAGL